MNNNNNNNDLREIALTRRLLSFLLTVGEDLSREQGLGGSKYLPKLSTRVAITETKIENLLLEILITWVKTHPLPVNEVKYCQNITF